MPCRSVGLWTNKGGVGKTTLTFHLSTAYAHLHPDKVVVVVDMCPQANLSNTVLTRCSPPQRRGSEVVTQLKVAHPTLRVPLTVAGYLHRVMKPANFASATPYKSSDFLTKLDAHNDCMPDNMWLFCGDSRLEDINGKLRSDMMEPDGAFDSPFRETLSLLRIFFLRLLEEPEWVGKDIMVFYDTNPAFTEYTQLALCSMDQLVVPVNADDFSLQAVDYMFNKIWNLFEDADDFTKGLTHDSFAVKAGNRHASLLPKIATIIHNRHNVYRTRVVNAFRQLQQQSAERIFQAHGAAKQRQVPVFEDKGNPDEEQFNRLFTGTMREMFGTGVVSVHTGVPLHKILDAPYNGYLKNAFGSSQAVQRGATLNLCADLLKVLSVVLEDFDLGSAHQGRLHTMLGVTDRAGLKNTLKWSRRKKALREARAAAGAASDSETESEDEFPDFVPDADVAARAFQLERNSCGPDSVTVAAALSMLPSRQGAALLTHDWLVLVQTAAALIKLTAAQPQRIGVQVGLDLQSLQKDVMQLLQQRGLPAWQLGEPTNLEDLLSVLCTSHNPGSGGSTLPPYRITTRGTRKCNACGASVEDASDTELCSVNLMGDDVQNADEREEGCLVGDSLFRMEPCLRHCATLTGVRVLDTACTACNNGTRSLHVAVKRLPDWLTVTLRRSHPDCFTIPDQCNSKVGPGLSLSSTVELKSQEQGTCEYELRLVYITRGGHHTVYCKVAGFIGLPPGWYFYDDIGNGFIKKAGVGDYPTFQAGEEACNISCMVYERREEYTASEGGGTPTRGRQPQGCHRIDGLQSGPAAGILRKVAEAGAVEFADALQMLRRQAEWGLPLSDAAPRRAEVGSLFLFGSSQIKHRWQKDGYEWPTKRAGTRRSKKIKEDGVVVTVQEVSITSIDQSIERYCSHYVVNSGEEDKGQARLILVHYRTPVPATNTTKRKAPSGGVPSSDARSKRPAPGAPGGQS